MTAPTGTTTAAPLGQAVVMVGEVETTYGRAGRGPAVLLLTARALQGGEQLDPLTARARVIVPAHTTIAALAPMADPTASPFAQWLGGFLEGIGAAAVHLVAPAALAAELHRFAERHPGAITACVLLGAAATGDFPSATRLPADASWTQIAEALLGPAPGGAPR